jgi:hypothetical protein
VRGSGGETFSRRRGLRKEQGVHITCKVGGRASDLHPVSVHAVDLGEVAEHAGARVDRPAKQHTRQSST